MSKPTISKVALRFAALSLALASSSSCARSVNGWATAMAGHAGAGSNETPRKLSFSDYRDCNGDVLDGRETDVLTSTAHCGGCESRCGGSCREGQCTINPAPVAQSRASDWRAPPRPLSQAGPTDVPFGEHGEIALLPFEFDSDPVESWRYDACVAEGACAAREMPQPAGDVADAPAVGMRWEDAARFCEQRAMKVQTPGQDRALRDAGAKRLGPDRFDPTLNARVVIAGFRCTRTTEAR